MIDVNTLPDADHYKELTFVCEITEEIEYLLIPVLKSVMHLTEFKLLNSHGVACLYCDNINGIAYNQAFFAGMCKLASVFLGNAAIAQCDFDALVDLFVAHYVKDKLCSSKT